MDTTPARHVFLNLAQVERALGKAAAEVDPGGDNPAVDSMIASTLEALRVMVAQAQAATGHPAFTAPGDPSERLTLDPAGDRAALARRRQASKTPETDALPEGTTGRLEPGLYICEDHDRRVALLPAARGDVGAYTLQHTMDGTACRAPGDPSEPHPVG